MTFNPNYYVSASESIILSGTVKSYGNSTLVNLILTNKKVIMAGDDCLKIMPLNQIACIYYSTDTIHILASNDSELILYYRGNPSWYNEIVIEISKRIG